ncbi:MAG TPA: glycoside hydrolase family 15 protein [Solirubrobacteraceae bacterium]|nr:glycoside hydrolase family 15 protein [Solirubrobacteraceae bacterium]
MAFAGEFDGAYRPIAEHGLVGDLHTVALVGTDGTIDWYCCPSFDAPSVFGAILDRDKGGHYALRPDTTDWTSKQLYFPDTNVLITRFFTPDGVAEIEDFMPIEGNDTGRHRHRLIRRAVVVRGEMPFALDVQPRFDYGRERHDVEIQEHGVVFRSPSLTLALEGSSWGDGATPERRESGAYARFVLRAGQSRTFVLERVTADHVCRPYPERETAAAFDATVAFWRSWLGRSRYRGRWRETVGRSALTLKLLTYAPTGAIVAAPTTSLPERIGGDRNWDYRYTWIRDAAFSLYALLRLGFTEEAAAFMDWLTARTRDAQLGPSATSGPLQIMYGIDGRRELPEIELPHWSGYCNSGPVRIGNGAADQLQLDIYGELIDSIYLYNKHGQPIYHQTWGDVRRIVDWLCDNWDQADEGIWETRGGQKNFTYSRLMTWVAFERAIRLHRQRGLPGDIVRWLTERDRVYHQIMDQGYSERRGAFVQHYGSDVLDASLLLMPLVLFIAGKDPRWISTLNAIGEELVSDSLVYRYDVEASPDGLRGHEGTFSMCSFWYVEALTRAGRLDEARLAFEKMLTYANHLGLYSEEIGPTGELLGNFPQAFTHIALISAAYNLDRALG